MTNHTKNIPQKPSVGNLGQPIDPTTDPQSLMGDTSGMTGIRVTGDDQVGVMAKNQTIFDQSGRAESQDILSLDDDSVTQKIIHQGQTIDQTLLDGFGNTIDTSEGNETLSEATPPHVLGEQSVSGDMPDPESDDDTLQMSHEVGLRLDEDYENPRELNIAADVAAAERLRRSPQMTEEDTI